jgi:hypothetical protein
MKLSSALSSALAVLVLAAAAEAFAAGIVTREQALAAAFPGAQLRADTVFLTESQRKEAAALAGVEIPSAMIARYRALRDGKELGRAYVDTHVVRTKKESLLIILDAGGALRRIELTAFLEPPEYVASEPWYRQYEGKKLSGELNIDRAIRPIAGATLTARATNQAARRVLAIDQVLERAKGGKQ